MIERIFRNNFDSWLNTSAVGLNCNADFYLIVRVFLRRCEPTGTVQTVRDADNRAVHIDPWSLEWGPWWRGFESVNEQVWDNRLWLQPQGYWGVPARTPSGPGFIPNVRCNLDLQIVQLPEQAHLTLNCYRVRPGESYRSHMTPADRIGSISWSDIDNRESQIVSAHEIGHYLGLWHVACPGNEAACYGTTPQQSANLMGRGNQITPWHAHPWLCRLPQHLDTGFRGLRWKPTILRPAPGVVPARAAAGH